VDELGFVGGNKTVDKVFFGYAWFRRFFRRKVEQIGFFLTFGAAFIAVSVRSTGQGSVYITGFL
jgi:hypothetical protein